MWPRSWSSPALTRRWGAGSKAAGACGVLQFSNYGLIFTNTAQGQTVSSFRKDLLRERGTYVSLANRSLSSERADAM